MDALTIRLLVPHAERLWDLLVLLDVQVEGRGRLLPLRLHAHLQGDSKQSSDTGGGKTLLRETHACL